MLRSKVVFRRVIWIVLDSVGIGAMPDAAAYLDPPGCDTLGNLARLRGLRLPNLARLGLGNIKSLAGIPPAASPQGAYGRCTLASPGKDTTTGHWEMVGILLDRPFPLYPHGFPREVMEEFEGRIGRRAWATGPLPAPRSSRNWARAHAHRLAHRLHLGRQRFPGGRARRGHPALGAVQDLRDGPRDHARAA